MTRRATLAGAVLVAAVALPGCGLAHPGITNGAITGCFRTLPAARAAVHDAKARLLGVHRLQADSLPRRLHTSPGLPAELDATVCAVAFKGPFTAGQVSGAPAGSAGQYAVVLVNETKLTVVASYVGDHLPRTLRGRVV